MNARRLLALGALACLTVGIAACGSEQPAQEPTPSQRTTPTPTPRSWLPRA